MADLSLQQSKQKDSTKYKLVINYLQYKKKRFLLLVLLKGQYADLVHNHCWFLLYDDFQSDQSTLDQCFQVETV